MKEYEFEYTISIRGTGNMYANSKDEVLEETTNINFMKQIFEKDVFDNFEIDDVNVEDITNIREV